MAYDKGNKSRFSNEREEADAEEKKFVYSVEKKITKSITKMWLN